MKWDYIIVGAGSAGCVLAHRLTSNPRINVLLLDAGTSNSSLAVRIPAGQAIALGNSKFDWNYLSEPDPTLGGRQDAWPRGKVLGGSSSLNGMIYMRGNRQDYDDWAMQGNRGWAYDDVLPYFTKSECNDLGESRYHGVSGPLKVSSIADPHPLTQVFLDACQELGLPYNGDFNGTEQAGVGPIQGTIYGRWRQSTAVAFLQPVTRRPNLVVETQALVDQVLFDDDRAIGVKYIRENGVSERVFCEREVVLSAGTIESPSILMRSGIGPDALLNQHSIDVRRDSPGVGQNLQEHAGIWNLAVVNLNTYNRDLRNPLKWVEYGSKWLFQGKGPAAAPIAHAGAYFRSSPDQHSPDMQAHFIPTGYKLNADGLTLHPSPSVNIPINVSRPESRMHLEISSNDPNHRPRIFQKLLRAEKDLEKLVAGCRFVRDVFQSRAFSPYLVKTEIPGEEVQTDDEFSQFIRSMAGPLYHPVGTCKMGTDDVAVVDDQLRVHGVRQLRVVDASIMPTIPSGNTNAPTIMIAEKGADMMIKSQ